MKRYLPLLLILGLFGCEEQNKAPELKEQKDKLSYVIGRDIGSNFKRQAIDINPEVFAYAFKSALSTNEKPLLNEEETKQVMMAFQQKMMEKQQEAMQKHMAEMKEKGEKNKQEGETFLAENKKKEGIKTTASGLQYKILKEGKGAIPKPTDTISAHYRGTLIDGTEFDSSYKRGEPATFPVTGVIPGWTEALKLMKVGSKWQLFIPPALGYGERGAGGVIGPNAVLVFEIELLDIVKKK